MAVVCTHVDDVIFAGREWDRRWQKIRTRLQEAFTWTDWESGSFLQCNVRITQDSNCESTLRMDHYVKDLEKIEIDRERKKHPEEEVTKKERTQLRGLLGGVQYKAVQQGPECAAGCGMLQSTVTIAKVKHLTEANKLMAKVHLGKDREMRIHGLVGEEVMVAGCVERRASQSWKATRFR